MAWGWHFGDLSPGTWGAGYQQLDEMFMDLHPGVTIEHAGHPFETYEDTVRAAMAGGNAPDAMMLL